MTKPMPAYPNTTYMESKRCLLRQFLLRPDRLTNQIVEYCIALAANHFNIKLHSYCIQSNHQHIVFTDVHGNHAEFRQYKNALIARAMNVLRGRQGPFWETADRDVVELVDEGAQFDAYAYTLCNPVKDGLVLYAHQWPGAKGWFSAKKTSKRINRPPLFFDETVKKKTVLLTLHPLPCFGDVKRKEAARQMNDAILQRQKDYQDKIHSSGRCVLGRKKIKAQHPFDAPKGAPLKKGITPRIKCADSTLRKKALLKLKYFWQAYAEALADFKQGILKTVFPAGTNRFKSMVRVASLPP